MRALFLRKLWQLAVDDSERGRELCSAGRRARRPAGAARAGRSARSRRALRWPARRAACSRRYSVHFVVNQTRVRADLELGESMRSAAWQRLGVNLDYLGYIDYDDTVWACVRDRQPLLGEEPGHQGQQEHREARAPSDLARRRQGRASHPAHRAAAERITICSRSTAVPPTKRFRRAYRRVREVYAEQALCCYGLFSTTSSRPSARVSKKPSTCLLDRARRRPYELSMFPAEPEPVPEEVAAPDARDRDLPPPPADHARHRVRRHSLARRARVAWPGPEVISKRTRISLELPGGHRGRRLRGAAGARLRAWLRHRGGQVPRSSIRCRWPTPTCAACAATWARSARETRAAVDPGVRLAAPARNLDAPRLTSRSCPPTSMSLGCPTRPEGICRPPGRGQGTRGGGACARPLWPCSAPDTTVVLDGEVLNKPRRPGRQRAHAARLSGREHEVHTGVAVVLFPGVTTARAV